jgi:ribonuclease BN (tRNA processing enzyme)
MTLGAAADDTGDLVFVARLNPRQPPGERLVEFVRGASVLVHDTMYTADEYRSFIGWGHSTHEQAVELALDADVERLVLFHHRPERSDADVDRCVEKCRAIVAGRGRRLEVLAAAEGLTLQV